MKKYVVRVESISGDLQTGFFHTDYLPPKDSEVMVADIKYVVKSIIPVLDCDYIKLIVYDC